MQFDTSMLPAGTRAIVTFEELVVWATQALSDGNAKDTFVRKSGTLSEQTVGWGNFQDADYLYRLQCVVIPKVDPSKLGLNLPDWKKILEISATPCAAQYKG